MNFTNIKVINKLITAVVALIVLLILTLGFVFFKQSQIKEQQSISVIKRNLATQVSEELRQSSDDLTTAARSYAASGERRFLEYYNQILAIRNGEQNRPQDYSSIYWDFVFDNGKKPRPDTDIAVALEVIAQNASFTKDEIGIIEKAHKLSDTLAKFEVEAFNAVDGKYIGADGNFSKIGLPDKDLAVNLLYGKQYFQQKAKIMEPLNKLQEELGKRSEKEIESFKSTLKTYGLLLTILAGLIFVVLLLLGFLFSKKNAVELKQRQAAQEKAEKENEQLNDSVINILQAVNELSSRDLTARAPVTEDVIGTVSDSINLLADETATVLHDVTDIAGHVSEVSDSVRGQAMQVSETAEQERQSVQRMIETLFDATQTMNQVAALAEQSNESAIQATDVTQGALETVTKTVGGMESIRETISETEKRIKRLGERSQEISGIVNLINTISERTHVLALNASMQAAVAGEAGRGFAVVAEEVQQLAESSRNATEQISTLVNNIQIETNETINTVNHTIAQVVEGSEQAQQAGEQMRRTQQITAQLVAQVQDIAQSSTKQKDMSAQLLEAVQAIGDSTEKTAEQILAQNTGTEELQKAAKQLVDSVNVFKLPQKA